MAGFRHRRRLQTRKLVRARALLPLAGLVVLAGWATATHSTPAAFRVGITSTQFTAGGRGNPAAIRRARRLLDTFAVQNQFIYGWGVNDPEPQPGRYSWSTLDARVHLLLSTQRRVVLTLCGAPPWMTHTPATASGATKLNAAPTPAHFKDFASLAARIAQRYPRIHYFQVWSEMRGFFDHATNTWNDDAYTRFYNDVYRAIKAVRPDAQIGGPYVASVFYSLKSPIAFHSAVGGSWGYVDPRVLRMLRYWLARKVGAQFLSLDVGLKTRMPGGHSVPQSPSDSAAALAAMDNWLEHETKLPIWWSEVRPDDAKTPLSPNRAVAAATAAVWALRRSGASVALFWCPERCGDGSPGMWSSTAVPGGGRPTALYKSLATHGVLDRMERPGSPGAVKG